MSLHVAFIRHGDYHQKPDCPSAWQPFPLNDKGRDQAIHAAHRIKACCDDLDLKLIDPIDSSNLCRAWQTAEIIRAELDQAIAVKSHDALAERSVGSAANLTISEIEAVLATDPRFDNPPPDWKSNSHYRLPLQGAESLMEAGERVATHVRQQVEALSSADNAPRLKIFVGHGAAFRHAAHLLGALEFHEIAKLSMYHGEPLVFRVSRNVEGMTLNKVWGDWKVRASHKEPMD